MTKHIACTNVVPGCAFTAQAKNEQELLTRVAEHARTVHGITDITPDLLAKVRNAIAVVES